MRQGRQGKNYEMKSEPAGRTGIRFVISCMHRRLVEAGTGARHSQQPEPARRAETYYQAAGMPSGMSVFVYKEVGQHQRTEGAPVLCVKRGGTYMWRYIRDQP